jgi:DNA-binding GntR family transcriptional regulator
MARRPPHPRARPRLLVVEGFYDRLKERILSGEHLPGSHLVEAALTRAHKVSRATAREALRRLLADDLVELVAHRGARVRQLTSRDVVELYTVREPLEGLAARLAARAPAAAQARLLRIHEEAQGAVAARDRLRFARLNARLHLGIAEATGNRSLIAVVGRLNTQMVGYQFLSVANALDHERAQRDHGEVLAAILARDAEAAEEAMRRHLRANRDAIVRAAGGDGTEPAGGGPPETTLARRAAARPGERLAHRA